MNYVFVNNNSKDNSLLDSIIGEKNVIFSEEIDNKVLSLLKENDTLIVQNTSFLSNGFKRVLEILDKLIKAKVTLNIFEENKTLNFCKMDQSELLSTISDLYFCCLSHKNKSVQQQLLENGKSRGRPKGTMYQKLDGQQEQIKKMLADGVSKADISRKYGVTWLTVMRFVKKHNLGEINSFRRNNA